MCCFYGPALLGDDLQKHVITTITDLLVRIRDNTTIATITNKCAPFMVMIYFKFVLWRLLTKVPVEDS